jgi:hypothetical protein
MDVKHMSYRAFAVAAVSLGATMCAHAQPVDWQAASTPELELTTHLNERLDIRFGVTDRPARSARSPGSAFEVMGEEMAFSALVDWSINDYGLRMRGGARYGDDRSAMEDWSFSAIESENVQTYVGLGWDNGIGHDGRLGLSLDMGLSFQSLPADGETDADARMLLDESSGLGDTFESLRYTPSVSAGLEYRF